MPKTRILMIGGFLGAGKTTAIARLARQYLNAGKRVAVVTNDQAHGLVDTESLRGQGLSVGEVPGACFCCKFDDLVETLVKLEAEQRPDIILTEPVGSCTDLVATVIEPLRRLHGDRYEVGRLAVLCKPEHGRKILAGGDAAGGFSPKAEYIFLKQLEEADIVVVNKVDALSDADTTRLAALVGEHSAGKPVLLASGKRGDGFDELARLLAEPRGPSRAPMDVDYDVYAEGEAELAWLNATIDVNATGGAMIDVDRLAVDAVARLADASAARGDEPAHIKVLGYADGGACVANLVCSEGPAELSLASGQRSAAVRLVVNARVAGDPEQLAASLGPALDRVAGTYTYEVTALQQFRPGRPRPTHRMS
ncbi:MAG: GTP-binding protein [Planctomycetota bacterium]